MNARTNQYAREILGIAAALTSRGWCQRVSAEDQNGAPLLFPRDPEACAWCAGGALDKAVDAVRDGQDPVDWRATSLAYAEVLAAVAAETAVGRGDASDEAVIAYWNDQPGRTQREVVGLLNAVRKEFEEG